jgi:hypothetical protein
MKTMTIRNMKVGFLSLFALMTLAMTACNPKSSGNSDPGPAPVYPYGQCGTPNCYNGTNGIVTGQYPSYSGQTLPSYMGVPALEMVSFNVASTGNGMATFNGQITFNTQGAPYYCGGMPLPPQSPITSVQPGQESISGAFQGYVMIGQMQGMIYLFPGQAQGQGYLQLRLQCGDLLMNF